MSNNNWQAGVATAVITPDQPMWLAGFARRTRPAQSAASNLHCKVLALEDSTGHRLVILTADLIAMPREMADHIASQCAARFGLARHQLLLSTSHTHSGPEIRPAKALFFNIPAGYVAKIPAYVDWLQQRMIQTIGQALDRLSPARIYASHGTADFAHNRRGADDYIDHDVPVLRVTDPAGVPRAILFGYACHNTTLWENTSVYCGDFAGFAQTAIEENFPGAVAMFICGAAADQNPEPRGQLAHAQQHGRQLAAAVDASVDSAIEIIGNLTSQIEQVALDFLPLPSPEELKAQSRSTDAPAARKARYLLDQLSRGITPAQTYPCPIQVIRLGAQMLLIAIGGEPVAEYAMNLKSEFAGQADVIWTAGYANDMFGYVPTLRVQREGGYEGGRAMLFSALPMPWTDTVEPRIMTAIRAMVARST